MDPVSFVFAAYMDAVQNTVHAQITDILGTEVTKIGSDSNIKSRPVRWDLKLKYPLTLKDQ